MSQENKEHRIAVRGFVSLKGRKSDLPLLGFRGSLIFVSSPTLIGVKKVGSLSQFPLTEAVDCYTGLYESF